jgi:hypothetical protein
MKRLLSFPFVLLAHACAAPPRGCMLVAEE